jgi:hypothetical protein
MPGRNHWRTRARSVFLLAVFRLKPHHFCCCRRHTNLVNSNRMIQSRPITKALSCGLWSPKKSSSNADFVSSLPRLAGRWDAPRTTPISPFPHTMFVHSKKLLFFLSSPQIRCPPFSSPTSTALEYEARHTDCWLTISRHQCSTSGLGNWELHPYGPLLQ